MNHKKREELFLVKVCVNQEACIGCGMCIDICPEVFKYNSDDKSEAAVQEVPSDLEDKAAEAKDVCPVDAIEIE